MYRDNDSGLRPSSYPYILGRALNHYKIKPAVSICIIIHEQSEWPEAQPRASNEASVLLPLSNLGRKHILMA